MATFVSMILVTLNDISQYTGQNITFNCESFKLRGNIYFFDFGVHIMPFDTSLVKSVQEQN